MAHKFDPSKLQKLDDPSRLELFDPLKVFREFGLKRGMKVLDVGSGAGFYLPYLSELVGQEGKVYGVDIEPLAVEYAGKKCQNLSLSNVEVILSQENHIPLSDNSVDFVSMVFVFHELEKPVEFMREVKRVCKPLAFLAIIDWKKEERDKGPPPEEVYSEWEVGLMLEEAGLRVGRVVEIGNYCFGVYAMVVKEEQGRFESPIKIPPGLL
ncbi:MAG: methyltransferase domain-containing protein [Aquificaceae bacterium]|nr:methyltransferase domain-containing protein [Aquificaceae bacterium]MCS7195939.1 methyltransferase domain-containing protein [Aquificaceae bacterium]MCX7990084.1 methyltransferase domain-containing protein [Aquificaceae bacterium]MDW8032586.1 methyltransferase domain-containing protein [Aquificaceae bacterium]MDW8294908.1 methyltransferase domain-containing protein [Aquificaceae bacterium]